MLYCTYITTYSGNKLPPFYIGSTSLIKIENGYRGSVSSSEYRATWRSELRNNPHLFKTKIIFTTSSRRAAADKETKLQIQLKVVENNLYINKAVFKNNHIFYSPIKGSRDGKNNPNYGKKHPYKPRGYHKKKPRTYEHRLNLSRSLIGHKIDDLTRNKISDAKTVFTWIIKDGSNNIHHVKSLRRWCTSNFSNSHSAYCNLSSMKAYKGFVVVDKKRN